MAIVDKSKNTIVPIINSKGFGATWGDLVATWGDTYFDWGSTPSFVNKTKSAVIGTNKTKHNAS